MAALKPQVCSVTNHVYQNKHIRHAKAKCVESLRQGLAEIINTFLFCLLLPLLLPLPLLQRFAATIASAVVHPLMVTVFKYCHQLNFQFSSQMKFVNFLKISHGKKQLEGNLRGLKGQAFSRPTLGLANTYILSSLVRM